MSEEHVRRGTGAASPPSIPPSVPQPVSVKVRQPMSRKTKLMITATVASVAFFALVYNLFGVIGVIIVLSVVFLALATVESRKRTERMKEERAQLARQLIQDRKDRHVDINELRNKRRRSFVIFVANQAGDGSKTTTCAYLALTFMARLRGVPVIIVECRRDSAQGVDKHHLDANAVTSIRDFYGLVDNGELYNEDGSLSNELIMERLAISEGGICYLQADLTAPVVDTFGKDEAAKVIEVLRSTGAIIIIDSGNNPTDPITIGMANESHAGVFPSVPTSKSFTMRRRTIEAFKTHVSSSIVRDSISVLNAYDGSQPLEYLKQLMEPFSPGRLFVTRFDHGMKDNPVTDTDSGTKVAELDKIMPENRDEFERMVQELLAIFVSQAERPAASVVQLPDEAQRGRVAQ